MRDVIGRMRWGMMGGGICGTDHLPEIGPAGLPFFGLTPPTHGNHKTGAGKDQLTEKRMLILYLTC